MWNIECVNQKLSTCIICRNERNYLPKCLQSVEALADEIIVVDSGSTDGSLEWLREYQKAHPKLKLHERAWPGDFSNQRNYCLGLATGDWILFLDADETIDRDSHSKIKKAVENENVQSYNLEIRNYTYDFTEMGYRDGYVTTKLHRLFRRDPSIFYSGIIHEQVEPQLDLSKSKDLDILIHHEGKIKEADLGIRNQRLKFYEELALKKREQNLFDAQSHWELGVVYLKQREMPKAEISFFRAHELSPQTDEFEVYYLLSLFQQNAWPRILKHPFQTKRSRFFEALARAQSDASSIERLFDYHQQFSQAPALAFEIALRTQQLQNFPNVRIRAQELATPKGILEFIEGAYLRSQSRFSEALPLLRASGLVQAAQELIICWLKLNQHQAVVEYYRSLSDQGKKLLSPETMKMIRLAHLNLNLEFGN